MTNEQMGCFGEDAALGDGTACRQPARYVARLSWSTCPRFYLCEQHAAEERALGDVIEIRSLPREQAA